MKKNGDFGWTKAFRRIVTVAVALMFAVTGFGAVSSPAQAALNDCPNGYLCMWSETGYSGIRYQWTAGYIWQQPGHVHILTGSQNNNMASVYDRTNADFTLADSGTCYEGAAWTVSAGTYSWIPTTVRDKVSCIIALPI